MDRTSGVLMHISSLPNQYGIGSFGRSAYQFVDFLKETQQTYWQILPLTTTSYGDSPYQSFSASAGNPYFIDLDLLIEEGLLEESDLEGIDFGQDSSQVDYALIFKYRHQILEKAVAQFKQQGPSKEYVAFIGDNHEWLEPFAEYMAIKEHFGLRAWYEWDEDIRLRQETALEHYRQILSEEMDYYRVTQFFFMQQWQKLKAYANQQNIQIVGDIPIYVAHDSVEMWHHPEYFRVDEFAEPIVVAGTPPDVFTSEGQFWGNPIYDWDYMKDNQYDWWIRRFEESFKLYDLVRIDHFRGFESYWEVPFSAETAAEGSWVKGPGYELFKVVNDALGQLDIIAEDLGFMTQEVIEMREATGFPGMKILQFGFLGAEDSPDLPHHYSENTIAYVGTHDNETAMGWYLDTATEAMKEQVDNYLGIRPGETVADALNRGIAMSPSRIAIYSMQDLLSLDNRARMNVPSTVGGNWQWRMTEEQLTPQVKEFLSSLTETYFRRNPTLSKQTIIDVFQPNN
ncbi:4-alpha-glucanotransferase [Facklamia sp. DSM 111018]|uniref:4-alpha-glucanotransferase n=1 Tax=Facklamia lactis TaxID=2749967 RepID=A0ABS0LQ46_9LACT|nr:4-alpha-glucanotransferase [Facklamia lactis]